MAAMVDESRETDLPVEIPSQTVLLDTAFDIDKPILEGIDTSAEPLFSVAEMAKFFFRRSSHWVRWLENCDYPVPNPDKPGKTKPCGMAPERHTEKMAEKHKGSWRLMLDGELLQPMRTERNARVYDLALIEKIAHALAEHNTIDIYQLRHALMLVKTQAQMHNYID